MRNLIPETILKTIPDQLLEHAVPETDPTQVPDSNHKKVLKTVPQKEPQTNPETIPKKVPEQILKHVIPERAP